MKMLLNPNIMIKKLLFVMAVCLLSAGAFAQHTLVMKSGEKMKGELKAVSEGIVTFDFKGNAMKFEMSEVSAILLTNDNQQVSAVSVTKSGSSGAEVASDTKGVKFYMPGRTLVKQPTVNNLTEKKGVVVVEISIDKYGNVMEANPGAAGTTTQDKYLQTMAVKAAKSAKFDQNMKKPLKESGTMSITF